MRLTCARGGVVVASRAACPATIAALLIRLQGVWSQLWAQQCSALHAKADWQVEGRANLLFTVGLCTDTDRISTSGHHSSKSCTQSPHTCARHQAGNAVALTAAAARPRASLACSCEQQTCQEL